MNVDESFEDMIKRLGIIGDPITDDMLTEKELRAKTRPSAPIIPPYPGPFPLVVPSIQGPVFARSSVGKRSLLLPEH
jgi:hypothetical protein